MCDDTPRADDPPSRVPIVRARLRARGQPRPRVRPDRPTPPRPQAACPPPELLRRRLLAQPHKTDEVRVLAARALRQHRVEGGTHHASWRFWLGLEEAVEHHGADSVHAAMSGLEAKFPPSWPLRCWMKYRQRRERKSEYARGEPRRAAAEPASVHFHIPEPSKDSVTLKLPPWNKPILRIRSVLRRRMQ